MKRILGKNVFIGNKYFCTEYTSKAINDDYETIIKEKSHKGEILEENVLFLKTKDGNYVEIKEIEETGTIALKIYGAATHWKTKPAEAGDKYVEVKPYFTEEEFETEFLLKELFVFAHYPKEMATTSLQLN